MTPRKAGRTGRVRRARIAAPHAYSRDEEHVGEWKLTLHGGTREAIFAEAARVIARSTGRARGTPGPWQRITLAAPDDAALLADWINELLGRAEVDRRAYGETRRLHIAGGRLEGEVRGVPVAEWRSPVKAATYHGLDVEREGARWTATVVLDI